MTSKLERLRERYENSKIGPGAFAPFGAREAHQKEQEERRDEYIAALESEVRNHEQAWNKWALEDG